MILILFLGNKIYLILIYSFYSINSKNGYRRAVYIRIYKKAYKNSRELESSADIYLCAYYISVIKRRAQEKTQEKGHDA